MIKKVITYRGFFLICVFLFFGLVSIGIGYYGRKNSNRFETFQKLDDSDNGQCENFDVDGIYSETEDVPIDGIKVYGSYLGTDTTLGRFQSPIYVAEGRGSVLVCGHPGYEISGMRNEIFISILDGDTEISRIEYDTMDPVTKWYKWNFDLGSGVKEFRLVVVDGVDTTGGWIGVTEPYRNPALLDFYQNYQILFSTLGAGVYLFLILLLGFPLTVIIYQRGYINKSQILLTDLLTSAFISWFIWWIYLRSSRAGRIVSTAFLLFSFIAMVILLFWNAKKGRRRIIEILVSDAVMEPLALVFAGAFMYICLTYLYTSQLDVLWNAASRYRGYPIDGQLQYIMMDRLFHGVELEPFYDTWQSSDRPPLFSGILLTLEPFNVFGEKYYFESVGTFLQCTSLAGIYLLLDHFGMGRGRRRIVYLVTAFSSFFVLNSTYLWPKMITVTFFALIYVLLWEVIDDSTVNARNIVRSIIIGIGLAVSMLLHGGIIFSLLALAVVIIFSKPCFSKNWLVIFASGAAAYFPWMLYQKLIVPPGDRLLKWHLAGIVSLTEDSFVDVLKSAYLNTSFFDIIQNKWNNMALLFTLPTSLTAGGLVEYEFMYLFGCLGPLIVGMIFLYNRWHREKVLGVQPRQDGMRFFKVFWLTIVLWCILLYGPGGTAIHEGSAAMVVMLSIMVGWGIDFAPTIVKVLLLTIHMGMFLGLFIIGQAVLNRGMVIPLVISIVVFMCHIAGMGYGRTEECMTNEEDKGSIQRDDNWHMGGYSLAW